MTFGLLFCCLYGKLISILIGGHLQSLFNAFIEGKADFELSNWKAYKIVKKLKKVWKYIRKGDIGTLQKLLKTIFKEFLTFAKKERKKSKKQAKSSINDILKA